MEVCVDSICRAMRFGAYCAIVVGSSRKHEGVAEEAIESVRPKTQTCMGSDGTNRVATASG